jgi:hypothetical protein
MASYAYGYADPSPSDRTDDDHPATRDPHPTRQMSTEPSPATRDATPTAPTDDQPRAGAPSATRTESWTTAETDDPFATARAPRTFDPFCTRRLRNTCDEENAAQLEEN